VPFDVRLVDQGIDWAAWVTAGSAVVTMLIVAITALYARGALEDAKRTRNAQLLNEISRRWDEPQIVESVTLSSTLTTQEIVLLIEKLFAQQVGRLTDEEKKRRAADLDRYHRLFFWPNLLEAIANHHTNEAISTDPIYRMWGAEVVAAWETFEEPIGRLRDVGKDKGFYVGFQRLAKLMKPIHEADPVREKGAELV
jgi:hypothetical protein